MCVCVSALQSSFLSLLQFLRLVPIISMWKKKCASTFCQCKKRSYFAWIRIDLGWENSMKYVAMMSRIRQRWLAKRKWICLKCPKNVSTNETSDTSVVCVCARVCVSTNRIRTMHFPINQWNGNGNEWIISGVHLLSFVMFYVTFAPNKRRMRLALYILTSTKISILKCCTS